MEKIELKKFEDGIEEMIEKEYGKKCIPDGIVNIDKYLKAQYKILWILKEPHDKGGQDWKMRDLIRDAKYKDENENYYLNPDMSKTFPSIIYTTFGILNEFKLWNDIAYIKDRPALIDCLENIALINIKKLPAGSTSKDSEIQEAFEEHKEFIDLQIKTYKPDIIIGANTIDNYMSEYFELEKLKRIKSIEYLHYYPTNDRVLIDAWHPANLIKGLTQEKYCDGIINAAKDWAEKYKEKR